MDRQTANRICDRLNTDPELQELLNAPAVASPTETAAVAGVSYRLGPRPVTPLAAVHFAALAFIESPVLTREREISAMDAWRALHVIRYAPGCLGPIMGLQQRLAALRGMEQIARDNAKVAAVLVSRIDRVTYQAWTEFDSDVMERTAREFDGASPDEIDELITTMLRDVRQAWQQIPHRAASDDAPAMGHWDADWLAAIMDIARQVGDPDPARAIVSMPLAQLWDREAARLRGLGITSAARDNEYTDRIRQRRDQIIREETGPDNEEGRC